MYSVDRSFKDSRSNYRAGFNNSNLCNFCNSPEFDSNPLVEVCGCPTRSHLTCLIRHVEITRSSSCLFCFNKFQRIRIIYPDRSCYRWLKEDPASRQIILHLFTIILLVIYLEYLSLLQIATQYQKMSSFTIFLLETLMLLGSQFIIFASVMLTLFMIGTYLSFRRTTGSLIVQGLS